MYKMTIKILQLCLVLVSAFKEFVEFSLSSAAQFLKLRLRTKPSLKQIFQLLPFASIKTTKTTGTKLFYLKMPD